MAQGDYLIRSNASNTDVLPDAGADLLSLWDTPIANNGASITYASGVFSLGETGKFLVMVSDQFSTTDVTNNERIGFKTTLTLGGVELNEGWSVGYIRKASGSQGAINFGAAIIEVTSTTGTADELEVRNERTDNSTTGLTNRVTDRSGITILKLDDSWNYGRYESSASFASNATDEGLVVMDLQTTTEEDSPFTRTTNTINIATNNLVLAVHSYKNETGPGNRAEFQSRLTLGGSVVSGSYTTSYVRNSDNTLYGGRSNACLLQPTSGDDLELELVTKELGGGAGWTASLQLIELPNDAKAAIVEATTGDFNTAATDFQWDTTPYIDTDTFTNVVGNANIDVDVDGSYLTFASQSCTTNSVATRAVPAASFRVNTTNVTHMGCSNYVRNTGTADHGSLSVATLLPNLTANDSIFLHNDRIGTVTTALNNDDGGMSVISLSSLFPIFTPVITAVEDEDFNQGETNIVMDGTDFIATQGTGKVEIGDNATYGSATLVTQTIDSWSDTSIQFDLQLGALTDTTLWLYVTNDDGNVSNAYQVTVRYTPTISDVGGNDDIDSDELNVIINGSNYLSTQGTGKVEIGDNATYGSATLVAQSIDSWSDTSIQFDTTIGSHTQNQLWVYVTTDTGLITTAFEINVNYPVLIPAITDIDGDEVVTVGQTGVVITGTDFLTEGANSRVRLNSLSTGFGTDAIQVDTSWSNTSIEFTVSQSALNLGTVYAFVRNQDGGENTTGYAITLEAAPVTPDTYGPFVFSAENDADCQEFIYTSTTGQDTTDLISGAGTGGQFCHDTNGGNSTNIGPTEGVDGDGYLYTEASSPGASGDEFTMTFKTTLDASDTQWQIDFYTLQRGPAIGDNQSTCAVQIRENGGSWITITTVGGAGEDTTDGTDWTSRSVDLSQGGTYTDSATEVRFLITTVAATSWHGDYGLDSVELTGTATAVTPIITNIEDEDFDPFETDIAITGSGFMSTQGTGKVEVSDNAIYGSGTLVEQTIETWGDIQILFDMVIGSLNQEDLWVYVTNDDGIVSNSYQIHVNMVPVINDAEDEIFNVGETNIRIVGEKFIPTQGTGKLELSNSPVYGGGSKVTQVIVSWDNEEIFFDLTLGSLSESLLWLFVTNDYGFTSAGYAVQIAHVPTITSAGNSGTMALNGKNVPMSGTYFEVAQGVGKVEIGDSPTYGSATLVEQTITNWSDTDITFTVVPDLFDVGTYSLFITNNFDKVSDPFTISLSEAVPDKLYKTSGIQVTMTSAGVTVTSFLIPDE